MNKSVAYIVSQFPEMHETFILREILELKRRGVEIQIFSLKNPREEIVHKDALELVKDTTYSPFFFSAGIIMANLHFLCFRPFRYLYLIAYFFCHSILSLENLLKTITVFPKAAYIAKAIKDSGVQHVHAHWATIPTSVALIVSKLTDVSYSFTAHAWDIYWKPSMLPEKTKHAKVVITCTKANKKHLDKVCRDERSGKIIVNYHGIDLNKFHPIKKNISDFMIIAIGRLVEQKGFEYLVSACDLLKRKDLKFKCLIIGDGPLRSTLDKLRKELELTDCVTLEKSVSQEELLPVLNNAQVLVAPSVIAKNNDRDGIPNVIIEAMALEVPVIGTNVSGIPEIVIDRETGCLVPERDAVMLADAIEMLYRNPNMRRSLGRAGREKVVSDFSIEKNVAELADIILSERQQ